MSSAWGVVIAAGLGTFAFRAVFLVVADRMVALSPVVLRILRQIPAAMFAALVVPSLVQPEGRVDLWQPELAAGIVAGLVSWRTRSVPLTLMVGMTVVMVLDRV